MKIGVAGLGLMGSGMANRLLKAGFELSVYNRTKSKAEEFSGRAGIANTPAELAKRCDLIFTVVTDFEALHEVLLGDEGVNNSGNREVVVVDVSTISPSQSESCATTLRKDGIEMLGMPVMGGPAAAETGALVPIVSGSKVVFEKAKPAIEVLGKNIFYLGEKDGAANAVKLALNLNIALIASAVSEGITLVRSVGIDPSIFIQVLNSTYFKTGLSEKKGPKMVAGNFEPSFHLRNMLKDLELACSTALAEKITLPQTALAQQIFRAANNSGYSEMDYTAIGAFLARINGLDK
ncbi:MAG TPA: NAD(P)-dependent oxidoreductase [Nitrososphaera sp.]|jgi:3-hydroxyisobutyrate dehydrogenase|nr:NAD(P)-dependent oxidoreductase [Nitrososphaera sp.]